MMFIMTPGDGWWNGLWQRLDPTGVSGWDLEDFMLKLDDVMIAA